MSNFNIQEFNGYIIEEDIKNECEIIRQCIKSECTDYDDLILADPRMCTICDQLFKNSISFLQHNVSHLQVLVKKIQWVFCQHCPKKFVSKFSLEKHTCTEHLTLKPQKNVKQCKICYKIFSMKYWHAHMNNVHCSKSSRCAVCKKVFKNAVTLKRHFKHMHLKENKAQENIQQSRHFKCNTCPKDFNNKISLQHHVRNCHFYMDAKCDVCGAMFKNKPYLTTHIRRVHYNDGQVYACDRCGKTFISPRKLRIHEQNSHKRCR